MTSFIFIGDPRMKGKDMTETCNIFEMSFPKGKPVHVEDGATAARLRRHNHFTEVGDAPRRGRPPKAEA